MEDGKKPRNPATTKMRTISRKRKKKENEEKVIPEPRTPEKQSFPKRRKTEKTTRSVARTLIFNQNIVPTFPTIRRRMATRSRSDFQCLLFPGSFPMPIWRKQSRRSIRRKNVIRWARIALSLECLEEIMPSVASHHKDIHQKHMKITS